MEYKMFHLSIGKRNATQWSKNRKGKKIDTEDVRKKALINKTIQTWCLRIFNEVREMLLTLDTSMCSTQTLHILDEMLFIVQVRDVLFEKPKFIIEQFERFVDCINMGGIEFESGQNEYEYDEEEEEEYEDIL
jgi:hypothetical protein